MGTTAPIVDARHNHAELSALFMKAGFPGDLPVGNKTKNAFPGFAGPCSDLKSAYVLRVS